MGVLLCVRQLLVTHAATASRITTHLNGYSMGIHDPNSRESNKLERKWTMKWTHMETIRKVQGDRM